MARSYPNFVNCADPGDSKEFTSGGNLFTTALFSLFFGGLAGGIGVLLSLAITQTVEAGCVAGAAVVGFLLAGLEGFRLWYRNDRLMCIDKDRCIVGTMADDPQVAFDGDRKIDMLLAPFIFRDEVSNDPTNLASLNCKDYFIAEILEHPELFGPGPIDINETSQLMSYIDSLAESDRILLYMRVVRERMFHSSQSQRHFQRHFQVRDESQMGSPAFNNSPDDTFGTSTPNPLFKMNYRPPLAPFLHCELEGNRWEIIIDNIQVALWTALAAFLATCAICLATGLPEPACSLIGGAISLLLALLAWWIANQINDPDEGQADQSDLDFEDPAYDGDRLTIVPGDSLLVFGDWIMEEEHGKYFELHPIKAIYLICNSVGGSDSPWEIVDDLTDAYPRREQCPYPMESVTAEDYELMCRLATDAESSDPVVEKRISRSSSLSMFAGLRSAV